MQLHIVVPCIVMLVLDAVWLIMNKQIYSKLVSRVQKGTPMTMRLSYGIFAYALMIIGFIFIILPNALKDNNGELVQRALRHGALFGFVVYGIYNTTNLAIYKDYDPQVAIIDTLWGTLLFFFITVISLYLAKKSHL